MIVAFGSSHVSDGPSEIVAKGEIAGRGYLSAEHGDSPPLLPEVRQPGGDLATPTILVSEDLQTSWSRSMERRFSELAAILALETISPEERDEFYELRALRRRLRNPMSAEEIIRTFQRHKSENAVLEALKRHVFFLESTGQTKTPGE